MAGENAANDVDEEVYGNDGAERHEAQEASAGDGRAASESPTQIKPDSLTFLVKRKQQEHYVLLDRPQTLRGGHTTRHTFHSEIGALSVLRVADKVLRIDELWWTRRRVLCRSSRRITCSFEQWQRAKLSHASHSWKRAVEWWSASCALGKLVMRTWRRKSCDILKLTVSSIQSSFNATKRWVSLTCAEKVARERNARTVLRFAPKQVIRATGLSKRCTDTFRDSHDATRHKSRRTLAYSFQQFHLPFHLQCVTLDLCSQDSQCDPTAVCHSNICSELHIFDLCACLVNRYLRWSPTTKCEQPSWRTGGSVVAGLDETLRRMNTWWGRSMVCLSADQFAGNLLESSGADVQRSRFEGRNGIMMWNWTLEYLDHLWLHVQMKGCRQQRHRKRFPQYLRLKITYPKCEDKECTRNHSQSEPSGQKSVECLDARHERLRSG